MPQSHTSERKFLDTILKRVRRRGRQINRGVVVVVFVAYVVHRLFPDIIVFSRDLAVTLNILLIGFLIDQILSIKEALDEPPVQVHASEIKSYERLIELSLVRGARNVDLIQLSGQTAIPFLEHLGGMAKAGQKISVRLFLLHPDEANKFDADGKENQLARITTTIGKVRVLSGETPNITIFPFFYRTSPGICAAIIDNNLVSVGWYCAFLDEKAVMRVRSHDRPAITAMNNDGLRDMVRQQVDALVSHAEDAKDWGIITLATGA